MKQVRPIFLAAIAALAFAPLAFAAAPEIEVVTIRIERGTGAGKFEGEMPQAVLKNASDLPGLAKAIETFNLGTADHVVSYLAEIRERFKDEINPAEIQYDLEELAIDRADERMVSLRAHFTLSGVGAVPERDAITRTIDCSTFEELTPDALIADKAAFIEATVRAIAEDAGVEPEVLRGRFSETSIGTVMGKEPEQLAVSFTESGARVTFSLMRALVGVVDVPLETR